MMMMCRESGYGFWLILIKFRRDKDIRERKREEQLGSAEAKWKPQLI